MSNTTQRKRRVNNRVLLVTAILAVVTVAATLMPNLYGCARIGTSSTGVHATSVPKMAKFAVSQMGLSSAESSVSLDQEAPPGDLAQNNVGVAPDPTPPDDAVQVNAPEQQPNSNSPNPAPKVLKKTLTVGKEPDEGEPDKRRTYSVQLTYDASAAIPDGAQLEVAELQKKDERKKTLREQLELAEDDRVVAETYLAITLVADGSNYQPATPVDIVLETKDMKPTYSDAVEAVVLGERDAAVEVKNLTGKRENAEEDEHPTTTKLKLTTSKLGEFGLAATVSPFDIWEHDGQKIMLLGPRAKSVEVDDTRYEDQTIDGKPLLRSVLFQTDPAHKWHPSLWVESSLEEGYDAANGFVQCCHWEDGRVMSELFGDSGTAGPVAIASNGEYVFLLEGGPNGQDQTQDESQSQDAQGAEGDQKDEGSPEDVEVEEDGKQDAQGTEDGQQGDDAAKDGDAQGDAEASKDEQQTDVDEPKQEADQKQETPAEPKKDEGETDVTADDAKPEPAKPVVHESKYTASDGRTYKVTVEVEGSAGIPKNANLVVSEVVKSDEEYAAYLTQGSKALDVKLNEVRFAKVLDITFVDPISGEEYQPSKDVAVTIELLGGELDSAQGLGVVHFGDKVQTVDAVVQGDAVSFATDGFSVYVVMGYTVDFHQGEYTYSIAGESSVTLSKLLGELKITEVTLDQISDVVFSDPTLVKVEKKDDDWLLTSLKPFHTEETLSLVLDSGKTVVIRVTDAQAVTVTFTAEGVDQSKLPNPVTLEQNVPIGDKLPTTLPEDAKPGFKFDGWLTANNQPVTAQTAFEADATLHASFVEQVTVTFYDEDETTVLYTKKVDRDGSLGEGNLPVGANKETCQFKAWYLGNDAVTASTTFAQDTSVIAHYSVTVSFKVDGTAYGDPRTIDKGAKIGNLPTVAQDGYRFDGWHVQGKEDPITADTTFDANATATGSLIERVTVTFKKDDGTVADTKVVDKGTAIGNNDFPQGPVLDDCKFKGWYAGETRVDADTPFDEDTEVTAKYTVDVTFLVKDASYSNEISNTKVVLDKGVAIGNKLLDDPALTAEYKFKGWFVAEDGKPGTQQVQAETTFSKHTTVVAKFAEQVTIAFYHDGALRQEYTVDRGTPVELVQNPIVEGSRFDGWFEITEDEEGNQVKIRRTNDKGLTDPEGNLVDSDFTTPLSEGATAVRIINAQRNMNLTSEFVSQITVRFLIVHPENKSDSADVPAVDTRKTEYLDKTVDGLPVKDYPQDPELSGYKFQGWYGIKRYEDKDKYSEIPVEERDGKFVLDKNYDGVPYVLDEDKPVTAQTLFNESTDVVAKFAKTVLVTFQYESQTETGYEIVNKPVECVIGDSISDYIPQAASKEGFRIEWSKDDEVIPNDYVITEGDENQVFNANYIEQATLTFKVDGAEDQTITLDAGTSVSESGKTESWPNDPTVPEEGQHFFGWRNSAGKKYDRDTYITSSVELTPMFGYTVTFRAQHDGNTLVDVGTPREVEAGHTLGSLPANPFWAGHSFKEWKTDNGAVLSAAAAQTYTVDHDQVIIAYFEEISIYKIVVNYKIGDEITDSQTITVDKSTVSNENPGTIDSPEKIKNGEAYYYPVMQQIQIVPDGESLGVKDPHEEVDVTQGVDPEDGMATITVNLPYKKQNAKYTVYYMLVNLNGNAENYDGENYSPIEFTDKNPGVIGAIVTPKVNEYDYAVLKKTGPETITADGDVFYVYYTRKSFKLTYETNGGQAISYEEGPYESTVELSSKPKDNPKEYGKSGYSFAGWYKDENLTELVDKVDGKYKIELTQDTTVYAKWEPNTVNYSIVYMKEQYSNDTDTTSFVYDDSVTAQAAVGDVVKAENAPPKTSDDYRGFEWDTEYNNNSNITVTADGSAVLVVHYKLIRYTLVFDISRSSGRISIDGTTYTGSNYKIENVVLGQDVSQYWPAMSTEIYDTATGYNKRYFKSWTGATGSYVTKRYELVWDNVTNADRETHTQKYTATWSSTTANRNAEYWLQQPDGTYEIEDSYTQIGLNTTNLSAKNIAGYSKHDGTPRGYEGSGDAITAVSQNNNGSYVRDDNRTGGANRTYYEYEGHLYRTRRSGNSDSSLTRYDVTWTYTYRFYYDRAKYDIEYYYGSQNYGLQKIRTVSDVLFEADINTPAYNYVPQRPSDLASVYTWGGWYADSALQTLYEFDKMPGHKLPLYESWIAPEYTVSFNLNYEGADSNDYCTIEHVKWNDVTTDHTSEEQERLINNPPASSDEFTFDNWYTLNTDGTEKKFVPAGSHITQDTVVYAKWKPTEITQYKVRYVYKEDDAHIYPVADTVTRHGVWTVGTQVTETAPYITGYTQHGFDEDDTLSADAGTKTLTLSNNADDNVITFYYDVKPAKISYTVKYVLLEDPSINVAEPKPCKVDSSCTSVTEMAAEPTGNYSAYRPTKLTDTLSLGRVTDENVLTFYYTKGTKITVSYLDMEGNQIPGKQPLEIYQDAGTTWQLEKTLVGYTPHHVLKDGTPTEETSFAITSDEGNINIEVYYQYNLSIVARSLSQSYDSNNPLSDAGTYDTAEDIALRVKVNGLKDGHTLDKITLSGEQANAGIGASEPNAAEIGGLTNDVTADQFYNISYVPGTLTVTKKNVVISLEPDRWTGNVYDGTPKLTGFTNKEKEIKDYIKISDADFRNEYLSEIWASFKTELIKEHRDYERVPDRLIGTTLGDKEGLAVIKDEKDAGDYYVQASVFETAFNNVITSLHQHDSLDGKTKVTDNYNIIQFVRECRLQILPVPLSITTEGAEKDYDGKPLTKSDLTVKVTVKDDEGEHQEEVTAAAGNKYTLVAGDVVTIQTSGSQTRPGTSHNTYTIDWGNVKASNYSVMEDLGELKVNQRKITITAENKEKPYGLADPAFTLKATYDEVDDQGNTTTKEIPATLTHWNGNSYTLQMKDEDNGFTDNLSLTISRVAGEQLGKYGITPGWGEGAEQNYEVEFIKGALTIAIARVSNDGGDHWSYHTNLVNPVQTPDIDEGAFNKANRLSGDVIVETLVETHERYKLPADGFTFDSNLGLTSLKIQTTQEKDWNPALPGGTKFKSVIERGDTGTSMIKSTISSLALENITFDGGYDVASGKLYYCNEKGGILQVTSGMLSVGDGTTLQNTRAADQGGAIYMAEGTKASISGATIRNATANNNETPDIPSHEGGAIYCNSKATAGGAHTLSITGNTIIENCSAKDGGAIYMKQGGTLAISNSVITNCTAYNKGGGVYTTGTTTVNNSTISGCSCTHVGSKEAQGGGIHQNANKSLLTISNSYIINNASFTGGGISMTGATLVLSNSVVAGNRGEDNAGGVYANANVNIKNGTIVGPATVAGQEIAGNSVDRDFNLKSLKAGGLYLPNGKTLIIGGNDEGDADVETSRVIGNTLRRDKESNVRLSETGSVNSSTSVEVRSDFDSTCKIAVLNANTIRTWFGSTDETHAHMAALEQATETTANIVADDGSLYGILDENDTNGKKIIWYGKYVCRITTGAGELLYRDAEHQKPALYRRLGAGDFEYGLNKEGHEAYDVDTYAFGTLMVKNPALYKEDETTPYAGNTYRIEMFEDYTWVRYINVIEGKTVTLTTSAEDRGDGYNYTGEGPAVITRSSTPDAGTSGDSNMFTSRGMLIFENIVIDGSNIEVNNHGALAILKSKGKLTIGEGATLRNGWTKGGKGGNGGAIAFTTDDATQEVIMDGGTIQNCTAANCGGAVYVTKGKFTLKRGSIEGCKAKTGGAVYVTESGTMALQGGTICGNTVTKGQNGPGIYLHENGNNHGKLEMQGTPDFDGPGNDNPNTVEKPDYAKLTNGGQSAYVNNLVRQDIYLTGYKNKDATSIQVVGKLGSEDEGSKGAIWVWADSTPHYKKLEQFAEFGDDGANLSVADKTTSMQTFRNARPDGDTECTDPHYLTGQAGSVANYIYWSGGFDLTFLKIDSYSKPLNSVDPNANPPAGPSFTLYSANSDGSDVATNASAIQTATAKRIETTNPASIKELLNNELVEKQVAGDGLVTFEKIPVGTYFVVETTFPKVDPTNTAANAPRYFDQYKDASGSIKNEYRYVAMRKVTVNANGTMTMQYAVTNDKGEVVLNAQGKPTWKEAPTTKLSVINGNEGETVPVYTFMNVSPFKRKVILRKVGENNNKYTSLAGAKFRLYGADWREIADKEYVSDSNTGVYFVDTLPYGVYYLVETQFPAGYMPSGHDAYDATKPETWPYYKLTVGDVGQTIKDKDGNDVTLDTRGTYIEGLFWGVETGAQNGNGSNTEEPGDPVEPGEPEEPQNQGFSPSVGDPETYSDMGGTLYLTSDSNSNNAFSFGAHNDVLTFEYSGTTYTTKKVYEWYTYADLDEDERNELSGVIGTSDLQNQKWFVKQGTILWYGGASEGGNTSTYASGPYVVIGEQSINNGAVSGWGNTMGQLGELLKSDNSVYLGNGIDVCDYGLLPDDYTPPSQNGKALIYTAMKDGTRHFWLRTNQSYHVNSVSQGHSDRQLDSNGIPTSMHYWVDITDLITG